MAWHGLCEGVHSSLRQSAVPTLPASSRLSGSSAARTTHVLHRGAGRPLRNVNMALLAPRAAGVRPGRCCKPQGRPCSSAMAEAAACSRGRSAGEAPAGGCGSPRVAPRSGALQVSVPRCGLGLTAGPHVRCGLSQEGRTSICAVRSGGSGPGVQQEPSPICIVRRCRSMSGRALELAGRDTFLCTAPAALDVHHLRWRRESTANVLTSFLMRSSPLSGTVPESTTSMVLKLHGDIASQFRGSGRTVRTASNILNVVQHP